MFFAKRDRLEPLTYSLKNELKITKPSYVHKNQVYISVRPVFNFSQITPLNNCQLLKNINKKSFNFQIDIMLIENFFDNKLLFTCTFAFYVHTFHLLTDMVPKKGQHFYPH